MSCSGDYEDRISNLPDGLIGCILSLLPTKDAVKTCVLSKHWALKWTLAYNIEIDGSERDDGSFIGIVDRILQLSQCIRCFQISSYTLHDSDCLETWISTIFRHNIEKISMDIYKVPEDLVLSLFLMNCNLLRELELDLECTFKVPHRISFPNLTSLNLSYVRILNDHSSIDTVAFSLPVLKKLKLKSCTWLSVKSVEIYAPSLSTFVYKSGDDQAQNFTINDLGMNITKFEASSPFVEDIRFNGSSVESASLLYEVDEADFIKVDGVRAKKLLCQLSNARKLALSDHIVQAIAINSQILLPVFKKMERLELIGDMWFDESVSVEFLFELLHATPFLECLVIDLEGREFHNYVDYWDLNDEYKFLEGGFDYGAVESFPTCLSRIKKLKFSGFHDCPHLYNLALFLRMNCSELQDFFVDDVMCFKSIAELIAFPSPSTSLRYHITENYQGFIDV